MEEFEAEELEGRRFFENLGIPGPSPEKIEELYQDLYSVARAEQDALLYQHDAPAIGIRSEARRAAAHGLTADEYANRGRQSLENAAWAKWSKLPGIEAQ